MRHDHFSPSSATTSAGRATLVVLALAALLPAQFIISEIHTGTPDFVEICNVSPFPASVFGIGIMTANATVCPSWTPAIAATATPQVNGPYVSLAGTIVPPGGHYVFAELGTAGIPLVGTPGESTGFAISWAGGSHVEVALFASAAIVPQAISGIPLSGVPLDYVCFQSIGYGGSGTYGPGGVTVLLFPMADGWRFNPRSAPGLWLSLPFKRLGGLEDVYRKAPYLDTDTDNNWAAAAAPTMGFLNPLGAPGVPTPGIDLEAFAVAPGGWSMTIVTGNPPLPFGELYNLVTLSPTLCAGSGPIAGLPFDVLPQLLLPLVTPPFHVFLDAAGTYSFALPPFSLPAGLYLEIVSIAPDGLAPEGFRLSNYVYTTTF